MTTETNRKLVEEYMQAWAKGDVPTLKRVIDDGFRFNNPPPGITPDKDGSIEMSQMFLKAFPDQKIKVEKWVAEGDDVAVRAVSRGTHKGEFMGIPPTNKTAEVGIIAIVTVRNGKIVEDHTEFDAMGLFQQLGTMPEMTPATR